jgi:hypothetical protein
MSFGPACERCGGCSYEGPMDRVPVVCPWCKKPKRRGSREELVSLLNDARHALYAAVGFVNGMSVSSKESVTKWMVDTIKAIEDA